MCRSRVFAAACSLRLAATPLAAQSATVVPSVAPQSTATSSPVSPSADSLSIAQPNASHASAAQEVLRPGDALRLRVWREPEWSGDFPVDPRGIATLPRLGEVAVAGIAVDSLAPRLREAYSRYLRNPSIEVTPLRRIVVLGAVRQPGAFLVDPTATPIDVLALAGGVASDGRQDRLELRRAGARVTVPLTGEAAVAAREPLRSGDQLVIPQQSWLSRNRWVIPTAVSSVVTVLVAVLR
jgi:polysaccharide export outer membrane protein